jgi:hypothetical protein
MSAIFKQRVLARAGKAEFQKKLPSFLPSSIPDQRTAYKTELDSSPLKYNPQNEFNSRRTA